ncbi:hypothetical protein BDV28DRAFT_152365 [Aspergillus coremiiformis]|uniref:Uncharacterized protein n=1 Tax=Aspergillus coremiiformis TaxID=138285 RepID=A0A5N6YUZ0_9EURO|nr:hypothetical protein BDV28DRAFT_152365 [Aspergillus coremiiformis]
MSRALKDFKILLVREGQSGDKDKKWQLRLDAGEVKDGKKRIYLQVNSQASNESLQKWVKKNTSHANLAFGDINVDESEDKIPDAFDEFWQGIEKQVKGNLG